MPTPRRSEPHKNEHRPSPGAGRDRARPSSAKALKREQEIYELAAEIFHRKGYAATTLQDIAEAAGMLKGSLYYYIDSKEDLLYRITMSIHEDAHANLVRAHAVDGAPVEKLRSLVEGHVLSFGRRLNWIRVFYTEYGALSGERRREIMDERHSYERFVESLIKAGQADGSFCPDLDVRIVSNATLTLVNTVYLWYRAEAGTPIETVARTYANFVIGGLRCAPEHAHGDPGLQASQAHLPDAKSKRGKRQP